MYKTVKLIELQREGKRQTICTEIRGSVQSVVYRRSSKCIEEIGGLLQPVWTMCLDGLVSCVASPGIVELRAENMKTLLSMLSRPGVEILADHVKERLQNRGFAQSFRSIRPST